MSTPRPESLPKKYLTKALNLYRELYDREKGGRNSMILFGESRTFYDLVIVHKKLGDIQGFNFLESELTDALDPERRKIILFNLGRSYLDFLGEATFANAIATWQESLQLSQQTNDLLGQGTALSALAQIHARFHRYSQAINYLEQAIPLVSRLRDPYQYSQVSEYLDHLSHYHRLSGNFEAALVAIDRQLEVQQTIDRMMGHKNREYPDWQLLEKSYIYTAAEEYEQAIALLERQIAIEQEEKPDRLPDAFFLERLSNNLFWQGNISEALEMQQQALNNSLETIHVRIQVLGLTKKPDLAGLWNQR